MSNEYKVVQELRREFEPYLVREVEVLSRIRGGTHPGLAEEILKEWEYDHPERFEEKLVHAK